MFASINRRRQLRAQATGLYAALVAQIRRPEFYREMGVPDSFDGRFDLLVLHAYLVMRRLGKLGEGGQSLSQAVFDTMFSDMDDVLREAGVGDLSIGRKIRSMSEAFYGRVKAYDDALAQGRPVLETTLARNVYAAAAPDGAPAQLAHYVETAAGLLNRTGLEAFTDGTVPFPIPEAAPV